ncbi:MAG: formate/nitrite transporter family protein [Erysipelotrichaceae bacterium]|nr:formate/nitrite transporter family protein [Erysipelotrichaceae bacterium]
MISPIETTRSFSQNAKSRAASSTATVVILGIFAGLYSAMGCFAAQIAETITSDHVIASLIFPVGSILTTCCGGTLFTGNLLLAIGLYRKKINLKELLRYLSLAYLANFAGSLIFVGILSMCGFKGDILSFIVTVGKVKVSYSFTQAFARAVLCGILVNLGAWLSYAGESLTEKICGVFFPTMLFYLCGFEHCITNMYFIPMAMLSDGGITVMMFLHNLIPVTLGNIFGGALIVASGYCYCFLKDDKD